VRTTYFLSSENWLLTFLWALHANSINATFWTIAHLLTSSRYKSALQAELRQVVGPKHKVEFTHLKSMPLLQHSVLEAIRLHSPGMVVRKVMTSLSVDETIIAAGDQLCISPFLVHHNPQLYTDPSMFWPERFSTGIDQHKSHRFGYIPFGAGLYKCPGQHFALMEIQLFVATLFHQYDLTTSSLLPSDHVSMIGIQKPDSPFKIQLHVLE